MERTTENKPDKLGIVIFVAKCKDCKFVYSFAGNLDNYEEVNDAMDQVKTIANAHTSWCGDHDVDIISINK